MHRRTPHLPAVVGGALWVPYGILELVQPWGADTRYDEQAGFDVVVDRGLHVAYSLPGSLALVLCAAGLLGLLSRLGVRSRTAMVAGWGAAALGVVSAIGVTAGLDPVFTGCRILGTLLLGAGALVGGRACGAPAWRAALVCVGFLGLFLMPLWPLVFALQWVPAVAGAAIIALHGLAWAALGAAAPAHARSGGTPAASARPA